MYYIITLVIAAGLGLIPANIAKNKGYDNFWLWWFYGWMLFIVALIHSLCLSDKNALAAAQKSNVSEAEEIKRYKELLDSGAISQEEFDKKKKQLLDMQR